MAPPKTIIHNGIAKKYSTLAEELSITPQTLYHRIKTGVSSERLGCRAYEFIMLTYKGRTQSLGMWAMQLNCKRGTLYSRIFDLHWPVEKALSRPVRFYPKRTTTK